VDLPWKQAMLDVMIDYSIASPTSRFSIRPALAHLGIRTTTVLHFVPPNGTERVFEYLGDPGLVRLDPRWHQAALRFVTLGFQHILDGLDHLLFVFCLVIPFRRLRPLIAIVTSFTVAHSITLIASASGLAPDALWFPPLIEVLIALSIVYMAFENIVGAKVERRWIIAFAFGLVHGFGFSFILRQSLQFAGSHVATSLVAFNVGVELGQMFVLAIAVPALALLFRYVVAERMGTILLSALVAHTAWHWMLDRGAALRQYEFEWPTIDAVFAVSAIRALMLVLIVIAAAWGLYAVYRRLLGGTRPEGGPARSDRIEMTP
jgi:HupE/UreJ protein